MTNQECTEKAEEFALKIHKDYMITYRSSVNLQGTICNMLLDGIPEDKVWNYINDIMDNIEIKYIEIKLEDTYCD